MSSLDEAQVQALRLIRRQFPPGSTILDIGFGRGKFLGSLLDLGYRTIGTEISQGRVSEVEDKLKRKGGSPHLYMVENLALVPELPDCTTCFQVLEHLKDPAAFLHSFPPGPAYFSVPNKKRWWVQITRGRYEFWDCPPNHLHRFDANSLKRVLESGGYTDIRIVGLSIVHREILQPIYSLLVHANSYSCGIRSEDSVLKPFLGAAQLLVWPFTTFLAALLNKFGYQATNLLGYGIKEGGGVEVGEGIGIGQRPEGGGKDKDLSNLSE